MSFSDSYATAAARWPSGTEHEDVATTWGRTHLLAAGPDRGATVMLLHGDGATATAWAGVAAGLARRFRVVAPDQPGNPGRSSSSRAFRSTGDLVSWWAELVDVLGRGPVHLTGHSAGAHLALAAALTHPRHVASLTLLDPTFVVAGVSPLYLARALPMLLRPTPGRVRRFLEWETGGLELDPAWTAAYVDGATAFERTPIVRTKRPSQRRLATLDVPSLVVVAGRSRAHAPRRIARRAAAVLPGATVSEVPQASHHTMPVRDAELLVELIAGHADAHPA